MGPLAGGTSVIISGANLLDPAAVVDFGAKAGKITSDTAKEIVVTSPAETAGNVAVIVKTSGGSATAATQFTYAITVTISTDPTGTHTGTSLRDAITTAETLDAGGAAETIEFAASLAGQTSAPSSVDPLGSKDLYGPTASPSPAREC